MIDGSKLLLLSLLLRFASTCSSTSTSDSLITRFLLLVKQECRPCPDLLPPPPPPAPSILLLGRAVKQKSH